MSCTLPDLLGATVRTMRTHGVPMCVGALLFGALLTTAQWHIGAKMQERVWEATQGEEFDPERLEELGRRLEAGDQTAMDEMVTMLEQGLADVESMDHAEKEVFYMRKGIEMFWAATPFIVLAFAVWALIALFAITYFLVLGVRNTGGPFFFLQQTAQHVVPLLGIWLWAALRSFLWIPVLGLIPAIILGPRFALAGVIHLREGTGVRASVEQSYVRTEGYWGKILGNLLFVSLLMLLVLFLIGTASSALPQTLLFTKLLIDGVAQYVTLAFCMLFLVHLADGIFAAQEQIRVTSKESTPGVETCESHVSTVKRSATPTSSPTPPSPSTPPPAASKWSYWIGRS